MKDIEMIESIETGYDGKSWKRIINPRTGDITVTEMKTKKKAVKKPAKAKVLKTIDTDGDGHIEQHEVLEAVARGDITVN